MIAVLIACTLSAQASQQAADYFPLVPGTKWVCSEQNSSGTYSYTDEVKDSVEVGSGKVYPIERKQDGKIVDSVFYTLTPDSVSILAYDLKHPLENPRTILKVGAGPQKWDYNGIGTEFPVIVKASSNGVGKRKVLSQDVDCIEVKFESTLTIPGQRPMVSRQTSLYAKGIGLVEMQDKTTVDRKTEERKVKLVEFTPGHP